MLQKDCSVPFDLPPGICGAWVPRAFELDWANQPEWRAEAVQWDRQRKNEHFTSQLLLKSLHNASASLQPSLTSVSHSGGGVIALAADQTRWRGIGVDIQKTGSSGGSSATGLSYGSSRWIELQEKILFTPLERRLFSGNALQIALTFSIKEAFYKAVSFQVGRFFDFDAVERLENKSEGMAIIRVSEDLSPAHRSGDLIEAQIRQVDDFVFSLVLDPAV